MSLVSSCLSLVASCLSLVSSCWSLVIKIMDLEEKKILNILNLALAENLGALYKIINFCKAPSGIFNLNKQDFINLSLKQSTIDNFLNKISKYNPNKEWKNLENAGVKMITSDEKNYPPLLKEIYQAPIALYVKGKFFENENYFSVVGTRIPSDYGKLVVESIVSELASSNLTIVSGMAKGIDALAHQTALEGGSKTIAILGNGLDIIYPKENKKLAKDIENQGALISEFPLGVKPKKENFPQRNRIIAGISLGTLVIEAKEKSGSLITAGLALNEGREVFAVPGSIFSKTSGGTNNLIKDGSAHFITSAVDILSVFDLALGEKAEKEIRGENQEENLILNSIKETPKTPEEIIQETNLETSTVISNLILMEVRSKIKKIGQKYKINK